jgi:hypothetical protein
LADQTLAPIQLAQNAAPLPSLYPTDVTPVGIGRAQELFRPGPTFYLLQKLPTRLFFNLSVETSQRYESNVFFTPRHNQSDYVYRILPNITVGYNFHKNSNVYVNYFTLKDAFAVHNILSRPTTQSLAMGYRREFPISQKTVLQFDYQARELWQSEGLHQFDFLPGLTLTRVFSPKTVGFANIVLQMRGKDYFVAPTRELDPFYTLGVLHNKGAWVFTAVGTLVTNFRDPPFSGSVPHHGNEAIIVDFEASHPITKKIPNLVAFARAEPIWNWNSGGVPGISGFDFRLFTGLRYTLVKPAYRSSLDKLRKQLQETQGLLNPVAPTAPAPAESVPEPAPPAESKPPDAGT